ncbi:uncharacterized protein AB675_3724 [Cyphellophora attinorum]|uniref:Heterokaryon incompatibility domain-containing protein n=1 Tax=Cyphellophora attinorum TaxID=1664694 RepID=A0A0N1H4S8_9EURO|nr:uncharacterized protein AB675_3724 [Phialophora attinorum]KPI37153.1 hypothetical protein AB675_3724 [Phialophora attinorum]
MAALYEYDPLPSTGVHFRLLEYEANQYTELMTFRLAVKELPLDNRTSLDYTALSYTWAEDEPSHKIIVNDSLFSISQNLYGFLLEWRSSRDGPALLWIDAVCINQEDLEERASQVRYMQQLFRGARNVIAWLGLAHRQAT